MVKFGNDWDDILAHEFCAPYYLELREKLKAEYAEHTVYPDMYDIFNAFRLTSYSAVNVVILGQDPYHGPGQAHGLAFSVQKGVAIPPSLKNIYKELNADVGFVPPTHGNLVEWAKQGVLLLNTGLTVREGQPNSHKGLGWQTFTDNVIKLLSLRERPMVFLLWGGNARAKAKLIDRTKHLVLESAHPSPLSCFNGFFGCKHFSRANEFLAKMGKTVDWNITD